jgi:2-methylisocitrate lyase-like PEP mutase family enzyme
MTAAELVAELKGMGAAGCNLEDSNHAAQTLRDPVQQATWLGDVRQAASDQGYRLVINARIDTFVRSLVPGSGGPTQGELMPEALRCTVSSS